MNNDQETCDPERIELSLQQKLSDEEQAAFELHLDDCDVCRRRLEATAAGDDIWSGVRDSLLGHQADCPQSSAWTLDSKLDPPLDSTAGGDPSFNHDTVLELLAPTDDDRMLGRLGAYEVVGIVRSGGMGVVLKAFDPALSRYVAIKVLAPHLGSSGAARKRFLREAQAAAAVVHDNVIEIHGVADTNRLPYLVMPYIRGPSLQRRLDDDGPLALVEVLRIAVQAATPPQRSESGEPGDEQIESQLGEVLPTADSTQPTGETFGPRFTEWEWQFCTLYNLESGHREGSLNLSRDHLDTLTEERWKSERRDALLTVQFVGGKVALAIGGAKEFRLMETRKNLADDPQQLVQRLRNESGTAPKDGHEVIAVKGGIFHVLPEDAKGRIYAFAVAMPDGPPVAGLIEIGRTDGLAGQRESGGRRNCLECRGTHRRSTCAPNPPFR